VGKIEWSQGERLPAAKVAVLAHCLSLCLRKKVWYWQR